MSTIQEKIAVMQAYADGKEIQVRVIGYGEWVRSVEPTWSWGGCEYRIKPETHDYINWDHVDPMFQYMARSKSGYVWLFSEIPSRSLDFWVSHSGHAMLASAFTSYKRGTVDWKDSLVERPE